jgi:5-methylcytosine-specific restriction endonuclease McrA
MFYGGKHTGKHRQATSHNMERTEKIFLRMYRHDSVTKQRLRCVYCKEKLPHEKATADHLRARAHGGTTERKNIKAACQRCNNAKGSLSESQFKDIMHSTNVPSDLRHLKSWMRFRLERKTQAAIKRLCRYIGMPDEEIT